MILAAQYSFKNGLDEISKRYPHLLAEVKAAIRAIDASHAKTKISKEKTMPGKMLYSRLRLMKLSRQSSILKVGRINR